MSLLPLESLRRALDSAQPAPLTGRVIRAAGLLIEAALPGAAVGTTCEIKTRDGGRVESEVVGFNGSTAQLMPLGQIRGIGEGCEVIPRGVGGEVPVGDALLGRVVDSSMRPLDGGPVPLLRQRTALRAQPPAALSRKRIDTLLPTGVRALDLFLSTGTGQRLGIMAGPGVGKSVLLGMLARHADADVIVVALVGERGREVREFIERDLGSGLARAVVVVATSDEPPVTRVRCSLAATAVAEYFRDQGKKVLLLVDSLTRVAMAQREVGLAAGEPPTTKGYPPSAFALLPSLLERAGYGSGHGSITAFYTVLVEGDDPADPIGEAARSILDGHLVLSRRMAEAGQFPAIDVLASISRVMTDVVPEEHLLLARRGREIMATYRDASDLVELGAYVAGSNPQIDRALRCIGPMRELLKQRPNDKAPVSNSLNDLRVVLASGEATRA